MSKNDNTIGSWAGKPLPYPHDMKENTYTTMGLVKLTQPDYFISYLEETGVVPKGYSKLDSSQKERLAEVIQEWIEDAIQVSETRGVKAQIAEYINRHTKSQTSESEEE